MTNKVVKVLLVEDDASDAETVTRLLDENVKHFVVERVERLDGAIKIASEPIFDVVLLDLGLPDSIGLSTFQQFHETHPQVPVVILTGLEDDKTALEAIQIGALNYISKSEISSDFLSSVLIHAIERKRLQDRLDASEMRFRALIENSADGISLLSSGGTILYESPSCARIFDTSVGERVGCDFFRWMHPDDVERYGKTFYDLASVGEPIRFRYRHARGEWIWLEANISNRLDDNQVRGIIVNFHDVTAQRNETQARERSEQLYKTLAANFPNGSVYLIDGSGCILLADGRGLEMVGLNRDAIIGKSLREVYGSTEAGQPVLEAFAQAIRGKEVVTEAQLNGRWRSIRAVPVRDENGPIIAVVAVTQDITEQKQRDEALHASEERFRQIAENSNEVFWLTNPQTSQILYISPSYERIWGRSCQSLYENPMEFAEAVHPDDAERLMTALTHKAAQGGFEEEYRIVRPDGSVRWILDRARPVKDENGFVYRVAGIAQDITDQKLTQTALQRSEERFRAFMDNIPAGVFMKDIQGRYVYLNKFIEKIVDTPAHELIGKTAFERMPAEIAQPLLDNCFEVLKRGVAQEFEEKVARPDGSIREEFVVKFPITDVDGQPLIAGVAIDITERKKAEAALRESEDRLKMALSATNTGVWEWRFADNSVFWSPECYQILGVAEFGNNLSAFKQLVHPDDVSEVIRLAEKAIAEQKVLEFDFRVLRPDGKVIWVSNFGQVYYDEANNPVRMVGTVRDVTRRRATREALRNSEARFRNLLNSAGEGIYGVDPHGITTFINPTAAKMLGYSDSELIGENMHEMIHHTRQNGSPFPFRECPIYSAFRDGNTRRIEDDIFWRKDGTTLPVAYVSTPVHNTDTGETEGAVVTFRDLTEQKQAEAEMHTVLTNTRCILWHAEVWDPIHEIRLSDDLKTGLHWRTRIQDEKAAQKVLPLLQRNKLTYDSLWTESRHPDDRFRIDENARRAILQGKSGYTQEFRCADKDGQWHWLHEEVVIVPAESGRWKIYGVATDITNLKQAEQELSAREALLRETGHIAKVGGWGFDVETGKGTWTEEVARIHDLDPAMPTTVELGLSFYEGESRRLIEEAIKNAIERGEHYDLELQLTSATGNRKWVRTIGHAEEVAGKVNRVWGSFQDITDLKENEAEREAQRRRVTLLADITERLLFSSRPAELLPEIFADVAQEVQAEFFFNYTVGNDDKLFLQHQRGLSPELQVTFGILEFGEALCGLTAQRGEPLILQDVLNCKLPNAEGIKPLSVQAYACHPLLSGRKVLGTLAFATTERQQFSDDEVHLMKTVADQVAAALERSQLLEEVRESENRFRLMADSAPVLIWLAGLDKNCTYFNKTWLDFTGRPLESEIGAGWADNVHPADLERCLKIYSGAFDARQEFQMEYRLRRHDGEYRWIIDHGTPRFASDGTFSGYIGSCFDIEERKRAEEALRQSESRLSLAQSTAHLGYMQMNADTTQVIWTDETFRILGIEPRAFEPTVNRFYEFAHPDELEEMKRAHEHYLRSGIVHEFEWRIVRPDGEVRWIQMNPDITRNEHGEPVRFSATILDITERKEAARTQANLAAIVTSSDDAIIGKNLDGTITSWNRGASAIFGYSAEEVVGQNIRLIISPERHSEEDFIIASLQRGQSIRHYESKRLTKDGRLIDVSITVSPIRDAEGRIIGASKVARDITERLKTEQKLQQLNDELEDRVQRRTEQLARTNQSLQVEIVERLNALGALREAVTQVEWAKEEAEKARIEAERANKAKSEFLSRMSHELRTPMNSILGFAQLMEMSANDEKEAERVGYIMKSGQHLLKLINEVLDIARVESGNLKLSPEAVPLQGTIQMALDIIRPLCQQRGLKLIFDATQCCDVFVYADQQRLSQVLLNLLSNAVKYNRAGGEVRVYGEKCDEGTARICISDSGIGISPANLERLFQPFDRLGVETLGIEGTGLGLSLTKHLIEAMQGTIAVESSEGIGSNFIVELRLTQNPETTAESGKLVSAQFGKIEKERTILYIEDNLANLEVVKHILGDYSNIQLISAMQGGLGLELARQHKPSLILLDLHLPDIQGDEVLKRLLADSATCETPVVVISADATPSQIRHLMLGGATDYLTKPIDVRRFLEIVHDLLQ